MAAIGRGGAKELLGYLGLVEDPEAIANAVTWT